MQRNITAKSYGLLSTVCRLGLYLTFYFVVSAKWIGFSFYYTLEHSSSFQAVVCEVC